ATTQQINKPTRDRTSCRLRVRIWRSRRAARARISSGVSASFGAGCNLQIDGIWSSSNLVMICSCGEMPLQVFLRPVNLLGDVARRDAENLRYRAGIEPFEIEEEHVLIHGLETLNQVAQFLENRFMVEGPLEVRVVVLIIDLFQADGFQAPGSHPLPHIGRRLVMRNAVNPSPQ